MDTNVLPNEPKVLHVELQLSAEKQDKLYDRAMANVGYGATTGGLAITNNTSRSRSLRLSLRPSGALASDSHDFQIERLLRSSP
jgi:hypothetical protein